MRVSKVGSAKVVASKGVSYRMEDTSPAQETSGNQRPQDITSTRCLILASSSVLELRPPCNLLSAQDTHSRCFASLPLHLTNFYFPDHLVTVLHCTASKKSPSRLSQTE